jgi:REP element-mobilizing transposase RayT
MSHTLGNILLHIIFSTHERRPLIKLDFRADLFAYLGGIVREMHGTALIVNGTCDHVHMLLRVRPAHSAAEVARIVKTNSSRWVGYYNFCRVHQSLKQTPCMAAGIEDHIWPMAELLHSV